MCLKARDTDGEAYHGIFSIFAHDSIRELRKVKQPYKYKHNFNRNGFEATSVYINLSYVCMHGIKIPCQAYTHTQTQMHAINRIKS